MYQKMTFLALFRNVHNIIINDTCVVKNILTSAQGIL